MVGKQARVGANNTKLRTLLDFDRSQDEKVELFVSDVNSHLRQRQEHERLKTIIARIESYEPVVSE